MAVPGRLPLAALTELLMRVHWVVAAGYAIDPGLDLEQLKSIGPIWGSWKTWRSCGTDNVICHDRTKARELLDRAFHAVCNLYLPRAHYEFLQRPLGVKLYEGDFQQEMDEIEDVIAMDLAASSADLVLLLGFDFDTIVKTEDRMGNHRSTNRHGLIRSRISSHATVQWVAIDSTAKMDKSYRDLTNLTCDTMTSVLKLLA